MTDVPAPGTETFADYAGLTDDQLWAKLGWAEEAFYKSRFKVLADNLNGKNRATFENFSTLKKIWLIQEMIKDGMMI